jgi:hypothetical protein
VKSEGWLVGGNLPIAKIVENLRSAIGRVNARSSDRHADRNLQTRIPLFGQLNHSSTALVCATSRRVPRG